MGNVMDSVYGAPWNHNESCGNAQIGEWYRLESVYNCDCDKRTRRQMYIALLQKNKSLY